MKTKLCKILILGIVLLSITGCGKNKDVEKKEEPEKFTLNDAIGTYKNVGLLMNEDVTYELKDDNTFDQTAKIVSLSFKGTFSISEGGGIFLSKNKSSIKETFVKHGEYFFETAGGITYFSTDEEYGKNLTLDDNGKTSQSFTVFHHDVNRDSTGSALYYTLNIIFSKDGTFKLNKYYRTRGTFVSNLEHFEGTYSVSDDIMTLSYDGKEHILLIIEDKLYFDVIQKVK